MDTNESQKSASPLRPPLEARYLAAVTHCGDAACARRHFPGYDAHRAIFMLEIRAWLFGGNPHKVASLTELALKMGGIIPPPRSSGNDHGTVPNVGLREYLCLLCDDVREEQTKVACEPIEIEKTDLR